MVAVGSETEEFAALLRELKARSGRSYGALAGKLHMSTSTVHRYCNGDAVPTDYAPVERFARLCGATPEELIALHRRWLLADAVRRRPKDAAAEAGAATAALPPSSEAASEAASGAAPGPEAAPGPGAAAAPSPAPAPAPFAPDSPTAGSVGTTDPLATPGSAPGSVSGPAPRKARRLWMAGADVVAVAVAVPVAVAVGNAGSASPEHRSAAADVSAGAQADPSAGAGTAGAKPKDHKKPSASPSASPSVTPSPSTGHQAQNGGDLGPDGRSVPAVPLTVNVRPYVWDDQCSQSYLVDRPADRVPPPPAEPDAASWAAALGGVSSDHARIELSVQGKTSDTVVLQALHVRIVGRQAPLAWSSYAMGDGCGGGLTPAGFDVNLDTGNPLPKPAAGVQGDQKVPATDFPYRVSTTDPQVLEINAHTDAHDVSWYLELQWSSGPRHGTVRIDDHGKPFRASSTKGRPRYVHPNGSDAWEPPLQ
ncbi:helix-turn-helix domain-containing protein [Streptomyces sp. SID10853]|uniref:helix-turn-helix domain-containing protein n=1 Tax=Streptomyces sp. SID10853 TaxID=2706028 RepID=UPI0013C05564|nr:helix-turn-helix transcriptional regulator [Streptomyces sp. SID10853]NDZ79915.1 helix-turn-helix domain-containing protein [Streptomyces sp. SID10853]